MTCLLPGPLAGLVARREGERDRPAHADGPRERSRSGQIRRIRRTIQYRGWASRAGGGRPGGYRGKQVGRSSRSASCARKRLEAVEKESVRGETCLRQTHTNKKLRI